MTLRPNVGSLYRSRFIIECVDIVISTHCVPPSPLFPQLTTPTSDLDSALKLDHHRTRPSMPPMQFWKPGTAAPGELARPTTSTSWFSHDFGPRLTMQGVRLTETLKMKAAWLRLQRMSPISRLTPKDNVCRYTSTRTSCCGVSRSTNA